MGWTAELEAAIASVAGRVGQATVRVGGRWHGGAGVVVGDGKVVTNAHNVRGAEVHVTFADGRSAPATLAGVDLDGDLAVLDVDTAGVAPIEWGGTARVGTPVFAVTADAHGTRTTFGTVSSVAAAFRGPRGRRISGTIEHTAPMAPGSSGSALVDAEGRFVALNTNRVGGGFYLALPADEALRARIAALGHGRSVERPRLGIGVAPARVARDLRRAVGLPERDGLLVREVDEDGAAFRAGIRAGDLIVAADGRALGDVDDLHDVLASSPGVTTVELATVRGAEERSVTVELSSAAPGGTDAGRPEPGAPSGSPMH